MLYLSKLGAVVAVMTHRSYASAKAEAALLERDLAFDFFGNSVDAKRFSALVDERIALTKVAPWHHNEVRLATNFGRWLAR